MTSEGRVSSAASAQYGWPCPRCAVAPYAPCRAVSGRVTDTHAARLIPPATGSAPRTRGVVTEPGRTLSPVQTVHEAVAAALAQEGYDDDGGVVSTVATNAALTYLAETLRYLPLRYRPQDVADVMEAQVQRA